MIKKTVSFSLLLLFSCLSVGAQTAVDSLMQAYDFDAAAKVLRARLSKARNAGEPTAVLEAQLLQAEQGERMLQATEKVVFIDSLVIPAEEVLGWLRLSEHAGRIVTPSTFFANVLPSGFVEQGMMFANDFGDRILLSQPDSMGLAKLHSARLLGGKWTSPALLAGLETAGDIQDFPFAMPDGQTLYFAAQGAGALGGFDIYVTRFDTDAGRYLKPAHLGFPFNSTANDYLYCIDEAAGVGHFVTDRNQAPGFVCLYTFIPNTAHDIYMLTAENADTVRRAARIAAINELGAQTDEAANARRQAARVRRAGKNPSQRPVLIVIDDTHVYTDASQLQSETAARIASEYVNRVRELESIENELDMARRQYAQMRDANLATRILELEKRTVELAESVQRMAINMRKAELAGNKQ